MPHSVLIGKKITNYKENVHYINIPEFDGVTVPLLTADTLTPLLTWLVVDFSMGIEGGITSLLSIIFTLIFSMDTPNDPDPTSPWLSSKG